MDGLDTVDAVDTMDGVDGGRWANEALLVAANRVVPARRAARAAIVLVSFFRLALPF